MPRNTTGLRRGQSPGRPKGSVNKVTMVVRDLSHQLLNPAYFKKLQADVEARDLHPSVEIMLWYYAFGKPKDTLQVKSGVEVLRVVIDDRPFTDKESVECP